MTIASYARADDTDDNKSEVVLHGRALVKHYPVKTRGGFLKRATDRVQAVDNVDLVLRRGETLGVVGESGCGKSTLARLLSLVEKPTSGDLTILGQNASGLRGRQLQAIRRQVQMVFQDPFTSLNPRMTVGQIIGEPFVIHRNAVPSNKREKSVQELLEVVGLNPDHSRRFPHEFSGGQRQRIGIARAIALRPKILICDEAVSALDVSVQAQIINLLVRLQQELGLAFVFIAHDLSVVQHIADRVAVMYLGKIVEEGTSDEIYGSAGHPYTQALLSAAPNPDPSGFRNQERILLEGEVPSPVDPPSGCRFRTRCWAAQDICSTDVPILKVRPNSAHPAACHFVGQTGRP